MNCVRLHPEVIRSMGFWRTVEDKIGHGIKTSVRRNQEGREKEI